jgi:hypothetical protein
VLGLLARSEAVCNLPAQSGPVIAPAAGSVPARVPLLVGSVSTTTISISTCAGTVKNIPHTGNTIVNNPPSGTFHTNTVCLVVKKDWRIQHIKNILVSVYCLTETVQQQYIVRVTGIHYLFSLNTEKIIEKMEDENAVQNRIQQSVNKMFEELDMKKFRAFKQTIFMSIAKCYDNRSAPSSAVDQCTRKILLIVLFESVWLMTLSLCAERYSQHLQALDGIVQQELGNYQQRIQRGFMDCSDAASDKFPDHASNPASAEKARQHMLQCASGCADKYIGLLKPIQAKIESEVDELARRAK